LNINTATLAELELLPRVGPTLAGRIIEHREANGPIRSLSDLMKVKGIGARTAEALAPYLRFE
jgi:competence protein ComEA